jgi:ribosomal protein S18 acetylase RimI-like enzyme
MINDQTVPHSEPRPPPCSIAPVAAADRDEALALVFSHLDPEDRAQQVAAILADAAGGLAVQGLFGAYREGRLVGAVLGQVQPGRSACVWMPRVTSLDLETCADGLLGAVCQWIAARHVRIAQLLLENPSGGATALLRRWGFDHLADLFYLVSLESEFPHSPPVTALEFAAYSAENHARLAGIVDATYEETRDCPRLNGIRQVEDVLAGYRATGQFDPRRWLIVRHEGCDVGCLLLADHPQRENYELVYMGIIASARGHGWGMALTRQAQWLTRRAGRPRLVLAVDAANQPALRWYTAAGFQAWERRSAYVKILPSFHGD